MRHKLPSILAAFLLAVSGAAATGCGEDDVRDAGNDIEQGAEDAAEEAGDAAKDAGNAAEDAVE